MSRKSVQINVRSTREAAEALREESRRRGLSLGDTLTSLLLVSRSQRESGLWLDLPESTERALRAVAAARETTPLDLLRGWVDLQLARELDSLASELRPQEPGAGLVRSAAPLRPEVSGDDLRVSGSSASSGRESSEALQRRGQSTETPAVEEEASWEPNEDEEDAGVFTVFD